MFHFKDTWILRRRKKGTLVCIWIGKIFSHRKAQIVFLIPFITRVKIHTWRIKSYLNRIKITQCRPKIRNDFRSDSDQRLTLNAKTVTIHNYHCIWALSFPFTEHWISTDGNKPDKTPTTNLILLHDMLRVAFRLLASLFGY